MSAVGGGGASGSGCRWAQPAAKTASDASTSPKLNRCLMPILPQLCSKLHLAE
jgi:hypothetical protein